MGVLVRATGEGTVLRETWVDADLARVVGVRHLRPPQLQLYARPCSQASSISRATFFFVLHLQMTVGGGVGAGGWEGERKMKSYGVFDFSDILEPILKRLSPSVLLLLVDFCPSYLWCALSNVRPSESKGSTAPWKKHPPIFPAASSIELRTLWLAWLWSAATEVQPRLLVSRL